MLFNFMSFGKFWISLKTWISWLKLVHIGTKSLLVWQTVENQAKFNLELIELKVSNKGYWELGVFENFQETWNCLHELILFSVVMFERDYMIWNTHFVKKIENHFKILMFFEMNWCVLERDANLVSTWSFLALTLICLVSWKSLLCLSVKVDWVLLFDWRFLVVFELHWIFACCDVELNEILTLYLTTKRLV